MKPDDGKLSLQSSEIRIRKMGQKHMCFEDGEDHAMLYIMPSKQQDRPRVRSSENLRADSEKELKPDPIKGENTKGGRERSDRQIGRPLRHNLEAGGAAVPDRRFLEAEGSQRLDQDLYPRGRREWIMHGNRIREINDKAGDAQGV